MPQYLLCIMVVASLVAVALARPRRRQASWRDRPWPLEATQTILSEPEQVLYRRLVEALPEYLVLPQVQLVRVMRFKRGQRDRAVWNRISQLSIDFLIAKPDTSVVAAVELDDSSHLRVDRQDADARKEHALMSAGVPLIRWRVGKLPDVVSIKSAVTALGAGTAAAAATTDVIARKAGIGVRSLTSSREPQR
jgi:very-short-patch-repair endonuclease